MKKPLLIGLLIFFNVCGFSQLPEKVKNMKEHKGIHYPENHESSETRSNRTIFYSNDFSNPSDWVMTNTSSPAYDWEISNILPVSLTGLGIDPQINSASGGNFAFINSFEQPFGSTQDCNMTNVTAINCSSQTGVLLSFSNYHYKIGESHTILASNDGVNFESFEVNQEYGTWTNIAFSPNAETVTVNLSCVAGSQTTVWIRFNYTGSDDYFWCVDDVELSDLPEHDLRIQSTYIHNVNYDPVFGVPLDYYVVPQNLLQDMVIKGSLKNRGADTATNAYIKATVLNSSSTVVYSDSTSGFDLANCNQLVEDSLVWTPTSAIGTYTIKTEGKFDSLLSDGNLSDNLNELNFKVDPPTSGFNINHYARDNNIHTTSGVWNGSGNGYIMGNTFSLDTDAVAYSIDVAFTANTDPGVSACVILYEIDPSTGDFNPIIDQCLDGVEYEIYQNSISTSTLTVWRCFCLNAATPYTGILLEAGKSYIPAISHYGGSMDMVIQDGGASISGFSSWIFDQTNATWYYMTSKPKIRLGFYPLYYCYPGIIEEEENNISLQQNFPNPAASETSIDYSLNHNSEINIEISDITGKIIHSDDLGKKSAGDHTYYLNVSGFDDGVYFYSLSAGSQKTTQKLIVSH